MDHIGSHIVQVPVSKTRATERGELMEYFLGKLNAARVRDGLKPMTMGRMAALCAATPTKDLYYLKSICDQSKDFSKKFWWEINPKKHTPAALAERQKKFVSSKKYE